MPEGKAGEPEDMMDQRSESHYLYMLFCGPDNQLGSEPALGLEATEVEAQNHGLEDEIAEFLASYGLERPWTQPNYGLENHNHSPNMAGSHGQPYMPGSRAVLAVQCIDMGLLEITSYAVRTEKPKYYTPLQSRDVGVDKK